MNPAMLAQLVAFSVLLASGQILFKSAANHIADRRSGFHVFELISIPLVAALVLYGAATLLWIWILTKVPLSRAYPFALLGAAIVPVAARLFFDERIALTYPAGFLLILVGLYLCVR
jgi:multidrug transporter EmrE-like cation transporter